MPTIALTTADLTILIDALDDHQHALAMREADADARIDAANHLQYRIATMRAHPVVSLPADRVPRLIAALETASETWAEWADDTDHYTRNDIQRWRTEADALRADLTAATKPRPGPIPDWLVITPTKGA